MGVDLSDLAGTGLEVLDLYSNSDFKHRHLHLRNPAKHLEGMRRLARAFVERPGTILQELVNAAIDLCGAESAGISLKDADDKGETVYKWVATAGKYERFLNAMLPSFPSACGLTIERHRPQLFRVSQRFFDLMGVDAPVVTDGILIPWEVDETCGTIWIMAHERAEAFDTDDSRMMELLADFAAMAVRQERLQKALMKQAKAASAAAMANELAHCINNPLQSLTNLVYLAAESHNATDASELARQMSADLARLTLLVKKLLTLPT
jgi:transcriptional regulator with GAF, ATPase, and Fis domain